MGGWIVIYVSNRKTIWIKIDSYIDERSDPLRASDAAAQYMTNMYKMFGDWDLVLASYNSEQCNQSHQTFGWAAKLLEHQKNLPRETQGYVPAFLATTFTVPQGTRNCPK
jgi:membrane-bound lytic murein transglycosylase D